MDVLAESLDLRHRTDDALTEIVGMRAGEAQASDAWHASHRAQQIGKVVFAVVVRIHGLPEQHHFGDS